MESQILLQENKTNNNIDLSEHQVIDCSFEFGNLGCKGGSMANTFRYIKKYGLMNEMDYQSNNRSECKFNQTKISVRIKGYRKVRSTENDLKRAVAKGPVIALIDASHSSFHLYTGGLYYEPQCANKLTHGVVVVGYGTNVEGDFWIIKNSFGEDWGEDGFMYLARNKSNHCGIASYAFFPYGVERVEN